MQNATQIPEMGTFWKIMKKFMLSQPNNYFFKPKHEEGDTKIFFSPNLVFLSLYLQKRFKLNFAQYSKDSSS